MTDVVAAAVGFLLATALVAAQGAWRGTNPRSAAGNAG